MMQRREFVTLLGSAAAWPITAHAQQSGRMRHIGVLMPLPADHPVTKARIGAFLQALHQLGWIEGRNLRIDYRWSVGDAEQLNRDAAELVALAPEVILATGSPPVAALQRATRTVPIVFVLVSDPVGAGFVASQAQPGGNTTGFTPFDRTAA
jgi:putative tryptophan/tyrosine transport system substrate-binding protein